MGTTADKLRKLKETKLAIKAAIESKGVTDVGNIFSNYPEKINSIISGGGGGDLDFSRINYDNTPQFLKDGLLYTENLINQAPKYDNGIFKNDENILFAPNLGIINFNNIFRGSNLLYMPSIDTSQVTSMVATFGETPLIKIELLDTSNVTNMSEMFVRCQSLVNIPKFNTSNVINMGSTFESCHKLKSIPPLNTEKVIYFKNFIQDCRSLERVSEISFKSIPEGETKGLLVRSGINLKYMLIKDLGTQSTFTSAKFQDISKWGQNDLNNPDARQSLIDTLITYSFNRKTANYSPCSIRLNSNTINLLTEEEKTIITSKGYTLTT